MSKFSYYGFSKELLSYCHQSSHKKRSKILANQLRTMAVNKKCVSMSSLQINHKQQFFVMLNKQYIKDGQWSNYNRVKQAYFNCYLNAQIKDQSIQLCRDWEQCSSYPGIKFLIERPKSIKLSFMDQNLKDFNSEEFDGFQARVIQHEMDHNIGLDYLKKSIEVQILDQKLKEKHHKQCAQLFKNFRQTVKQGQDPLKITQNHSFNLFKQFITYSIIDKTKD